MKNYKSDKKAMDIPWVESPFFDSLLQNSSHTDEEKKLLKEYNEKGYLVIVLNLKDNFNFSTIAIYVSFLLIL